MFGLLPILFPRDIYVYVDWAFTVGFGWFWFKFMTGVARQIYSGFVITHITLMVLTDYGNDGTSFLSRKTGLSFAVSPLSIMYMFDVSFTVTAMLFPHGSHEGQL